MTISSLNRALVLDLDLYADVVRESREAQGITRLPARCAPA